MPVFKIVTLACFLMDVFPYIYNSSSFTKDLISNPFLFCLFLYNCCCPTIFVCCHSIFLVLVVFVNLYNVLYTCLPL